MNKNLKNILFVVMLLLAGYFGYDLTKSENLNQINFEDVEKDVFEIDTLKKDSVIIK